MQKAPVYHLEVELDVRINRLMQDYTHHSADDLCAAVEHISRRLGGQTTTRVKQQIITGEFRPAIMAVLQYYDKTYQYSLSKRSPRKISHISIHGESPRQMAEMLMERENKCEE
jgi:tRNA 2-selenouridine synthase